MPRRLGLALRGLGVLDLGRRASWSGRAAPASPRPGPAGSACRAASARPAWPRTSTIAARRARVGGRAPRRRPRRTARAWPGRHARGRGRHGGCGGRSCRQGYPGRRATPLGADPRASGILRAPMLDRPRATRARLGRRCCFALFAPARRRRSPADWGWLADVDDRGDGRRRPGRSTSDWLRRRAARRRGRSSAPSAMTIYTRRRWSRCCVRKHRRAAVFTVGVMIVTSLATTARSSAWSAATAPSGRTPTTLLATQVVPVRATPRRSPRSAGSSIVLVVDARPPRATCAALRTPRVVLVVVVVCLDRVLLGRHYPTDVVGGVAARRRHGAARPRASTARCRAATPPASSRCPRSTSPPAGSPSCSTRSRSRTSGSSRRS